MKDGHSAGRLKWLSQGLISQGLAAVSLAAVSLAAVILVAVSLGWPGDAVAQSAACVQAQSITADAEIVLAAGGNSERTLRELGTARDLCPSLGDAWRLSYCAARSMGDDAKAAIYRKRGAFNGVASFDCPAAEAASAAPDTPTSVRDKHALLIGVGSFRDPAIPALQFSAKDARDLRDVLVDPRYGRFDPENVLLLTDEEATRANILNALQDLYLRAHADDLVVVFVSSHGLPRRDGAGLGGIGYIATHGTELDKVWVDAIEFQDFSEKIALIGARRKVTFLDTCYSGQISDAATGGDGAKALVVEGLGVERRTAELFLSGEGQFVVTSSAESEQSWESDTLRNGYFTHYLLEALRLESDPPPTLGEVFEHLAREVPKAVARGKKARQNPQILPANETADLRIGVLPSTAGGGR